VAVVFPAAYLFFRLVDRFYGNRVSPESEAIGLDASEMGTQAYPPG
jgi:ammonia channel protein AmtB